MNVVYFVGCEELGRIKIGTTNNIDRRLGHLRTSAPAPIELLATEPGGSDRERELHERFAAFRISGEWFARADPISAHIATLPPLPVKDERFGPVALGKATGWSKSYCCEMLTGVRQITPARAVFIYARTGRKLGPIAEATDAEVAVLTKFLLKDGADA